MKLSGSNHGTRGRRSSRQAATPMAEINIIPLVDITLVLLIIFMATTAFVKDQKQEDSEEETLPQLPLQLPQAAGAGAIESPTSADSLVLSVDKTGRKYLGSSPLTNESLRARVREAALKNPNGHVRIDADQDTRFQDIVEVIELCQFEGLRNVGLHIAKNDNQ